jgi:polysaccharide biosynthesis/export protein
MQKITIFLLVLLVLGGCIPTEKLKYTIETPESKGVYVNNIAEKIIQPYDYLYIKIYSLDETTSSIFNAESKTGQSEDMLLSYVVNDNGYISFPFIGNILVKDLTIEEAKAKLEKELNKYLTNVSLLVRFVGNKITIIGEVNHPGNYTFFDEKITVFQALGLAGDIADFGNKTTVTLLREKDDKINYYNLDLTERKIVESDYYYLLPNDILIIEPVKAKYRKLQDRYLIVAAMSAVGTLALAISQISLSLR